MSKSPLDEPRHAPILALLRERAGLLELSQEAIEKAVRRAVAPAEASRAKAVNRQVLYDHEVVEPGTPGDANAPAGAPASTQGRTPASIQSARLAALTPITVDATRATPTHPHGELPAGSLSGQKLPGGADQPAAFADAAPRHESVGEDSRSSSSDSNLMLEPGRIISGYRIEKLIGQGGMGRVYRATQLSMNRKVAFKVLSSKRSNHPRFRERFLREARAAGRLHHPNLIAVHDVGEAEGLMYYSMELVEGITLMEVIKRNGRVIESRALEMVRQALQALHIAHSAGIIHRDIKPENLMLTKGGMVKVADLGLALSDEVREDAFVTQAGAMMGTPDYMAPEQGRDAHNVDARADLYGVGATLYHLVCGVVPYKGETPMEVVIKAASQPLLFPEPGPSAPLRTLIAHLMAKKPAERPETAQEALRLIDRLRRTRSDAEIQQMDGVPSDQIARPRRSAAKKLLWFAGSCLVLIAALGLINHLMWKSLSARVAALGEARRSREAIAALTEYRAHTVLVGVQRDQYEQLLGTLRNDWDAWSKPLCAPMLALAKNAIHENRVSDAYEILVQHLDPDKRSPEIEFLRSEDLHQLEARLSRLERGVKTPIPVLPEPLAGQSARMWAACSVTAGPSAFTSKGDQGLATLSGRGELSIMPLRFLGLPGESVDATDREFLLTVVLVDPDAAAGTPGGTAPATDQLEDSWWLELGPQTRVTLEKAGMVLTLPHEGAQTHVLGGLREGAFQLRIATTANGFHLRLPESQTWIDVPGGTVEPLAIHWWLVGGRSMQVRLRPALDQGLHSLPP